MQGAEGKVESTVVNEMFGDAAQINLGGTKVLVSALVPFSKDITEGAKRLYFYFPLCIFLTFFYVVSK